jgi:hypothetical protein
VIDDDEVGGDIHSWWLVVLADGHVRQRNQLEAVVEHVIDYVIHGLATFASPRQPWQDSRKRTLVLLQPLGFANLIQNRHLLNDLIIQLQDILAADICRSIALEQFELCPYRLQLVEDGLLFWVERDPRERGVGHGGQQVSVGKRQADPGRTRDGLQRQRGLQQWMCQSLKWTVPAAKFSWRGSLRDVTDVREGQTHHVI